MSPATIIVISIVVPPILLITCEWLLSLSRTARIMPRFRLIPPNKPATSNRLFILFHGLWDGPDRFEWLPDFLAGAGHVLVVSSEGDDRRTPIETWQYLNSHGLAGYRHVLVGFSKGSLLAALTGRHMLSLGVTPEGLIVDCGPPTPDRVIWPNRYIRRLTRLLVPGPITNSIWRAYWKRQYRALNKSGRAAEASHARWCASVHVAAVLTGVKLLDRGIGLRAGEFSKIRVRAVFEHARDPWIANSKHLWEQFLGPLSAYVSIPSVGHGDYRGAAVHYRAGWRRLFTT